MNNTLPGYAIPGGSPMFTDLPLLKVDFHILTQYFPLFLAMSISPHLALPTRLLFFVLHLIRLVVFNILEKFQSIMNAFAMKTVKKKHIRNICLRNILEGKR